MLQFPYLPGLCLCVGCPSRAEEVTLSTAVSTKLTWGTMALKADRCSRHNSSVLKTDILDLAAESRLHLATQSHSLQEQLLPTLPTLNKHTTAMLQLQILFLPM